MKHEQISNFLSEHIQAGDFPSAVYLIAKLDQIHFADALGHSVIEPYRIVNTLDTVYDLASLTKPLITGMLCARRIEHGEITLDSSVSHYLPEFDRTDKQMITIRELLTHSSGLPAWRPLYILTEDEPDRTAGAIAAMDLEFKPGSRVVYSDLGFITLGILLERLTGRSVAQLAQQEIFEPLELEDSFFNPDVSLQTGIAACETGNAYEQSMCKTEKPYLNLRKRLIWGEVHDGNAYFLGGAAGHAGLFSTAADTLKLALQFLPATSTLLKPETCALFRQNMTTGMEEARSLGWQLAETNESTAGTDLPRDSFGHNGFTGTTLWIDAENERIYILLTNRTHAHALPFTNMSAIRRQFNSMAQAALMGSSSEFKL